MSALCYPDHFRAYLFGGSSYAAPDFAEKPDFIPQSLAEAAAILRDIPGDPYYPCIDAVSPDDGGPELWLFNPGNSGDYPDWRLYFGPRGGVRRERV